MRYPLLIMLLACLCGACTSREDGPPDFADLATPSIQLNQVGYGVGERIRFTFTDTARQIVPGGSPVTGYSITDLSGDTVVREGLFGEAEDWSELAGVRAYAVDAEPLPAGDYRVYVRDVGFSYPLHVSAQPYREVFTAAVRGFYYQRAGAELPEAHAGEWARAAGHPDTLVYYHPSTGRDGGTFRSPGGWYDAGDFNKYVVNGAFPVGQLLALYEDIGDPAPDGALNIPESGNGKSDFLDEIKYELDWLLTMQDEDGGVFHKLTTLKFAGMVMPEAGTKDRFAVAKSTPATLDFAAATAQAARVYRDYDPDFADRLLAAARRAWAWGRKNDAAFFRNPADVSTGQYGDGNADDERAWAAAELFATTGEQEFYNDLQKNTPRVRFGAGVGWNSYMANLAAFTLLRFPDRVPREVYGKVQGLVTTLADSLVQSTDTNAYRQPITEFGWGSNSDVANAAMVMAAAHRLDADPAYLTGMRRCLDYLLGNNPNGVCYLTGFGSRSPQFIHHRQSAADGVDAPVPGLLSGGPNDGQQDRDAVTYPAGLAPMRSWLDETPSYATNEIALNWNAPFAYVAGYLASVDED